ncbi:GumC family protein [Synechococcus sp. NOUM97013]|uniref:GumC family protein n=1 Tax=Synechococcus sp. NOUM97013 TaxID=1442555 RepID=UPI002103368E|nr:GumC family protein [Synechococcus sp. NOUM97013]
MVSPFPSAASDDEIDLRQMVRALGRQRRLLVSVAGASLLLSGLYAFTRKPVWEAQFQIVLEDQDSGMGRLAQLAAQNPMLANLAGLGGSNGASSLETEVKILESPSVLKPVYDFVLKERRQAGENLDRYTFSDWLPNLKVELEKGTSVLNIAYQDTNKDLVLPVIKRVSQTYQSYSGRDRSRGLTQAVSYLEEQLITLKNQANNSMRSAQAFALSNGLGLQDGMPAAITAGSETGNSGSVENNREATQNKVNALEQQLTAAKAAGATRVYVAPQLEANVELYAKLQGLKAQLQEKSALLRANDPSIQTLQRQISSLTKVINRQTIGLLEGQLQTANAQLTSLTRPREVVLKHRELVRAAIRDEATVVELERQLQTLRLEKARQTDPWELISTPTLLDTPVAPQKKRIVALGLLAGLIAGSVAALLVDRRTGLVFSIDELQGLLPCPLLKHLPALAPAKWSDAADLLARGPLSTASGSGPIALICVGNVPDDQLQAFSSELRRALGGRELLVSNDLRQTSACATQLLLTTPGVATRTQLSQLNQKLVLQGTPLAGWVLLDPELELS